MDGEIAKIAKKRKEKDENFTNILRSAFSIFISCYHKHRSKGNLFRCQFYQHFMSNIFHTKLLLQLLCACSLGL